VPEGLHVIEKNRQLIAKIFDADIMQAANFGLDKFRHERMQDKFSRALPEITDQPYIVLLHGTTWNSKYWPEASWTELIHLLAQQGWRCLLPWGNEVERQRAHRLQAAGGEQAQVLPKLSLTELMSMCCMPAHLSAWKAGSDTWQQRSTFQELCCTALLRQTIAAYSARPVSTSPAE
jgi:heptosyltransferase-1